VSLEGVSVLDATIRIAPDPGRAGDGLRELTEVS